MWTNTYEPKKSDWYLVKLNGVKQTLKWNSTNKFFVDFAGKTYTFDKIDCWLDDAKVPVNIVYK